MTEALAGLESSVRDRIRHSIKTWRVVEATGKLTPEMDRAIRDCIFHDVMLMDSVKKI